jgi:hypothetical protein
MIFKLFDEKMNYVQTLLIQLLRISIFLLLKNSNERKTLKTNAVGFTNKLRYALENQINLDHHNYRMRALILIYC